jgi:hypothetical protein
VCWHCDEPTCAQVCPADAIIMAPADRGGIALDVVDYMWEEEHRAMAMTIVRLKIDVSGTVGDEAWRELKQFDQIQSADFGPQFGSGGRCNHPLNGPHNKGEWISAEIQLQTPLLAQYAVSHYLEQDRVLDADVVE